MSTGLTAQAGRSIDSAQPYPWPWHGSFDGARCALVACVDGRWRSARDASDASDERLWELARVLRERGALVIAVTAMPSRGPGELDVAPSTIVGAPAGLGADVELTAGAANAFYASTLDDLLRANGRDDLVLAGWGLEGPVHSTMRAANDRGYECLLVTDACTPIETELAGGIFGAVADTAGVVQCLADAPPTRST
jgi:hypothetical protein